MCGFLISDVRMDVAIIDVLIIDGGLELFNN